LSVRVVYFRQSVLHILSGGNRRRFFGLLGKVTEGKSYSLGKSFLWFNAESRQLSVADTNGPSAGAEFPQSRTTFPYLDANHKPAGLILSDILDSFSRQILSSQATGVPWNPLTWDFRIGIPSSMSLSIHIGSPCQAWMEHDVTN
jgi:hypothetical protein